MIKAQGLQDEIAAKREMAQIDIEAKLHAAQIKAEEAERKLEMAAAQIDLKRVEMENQARALELKAREAELKGVESEMKHTAASKGYEAKMADLHREHGLPGADEIKSIVDNVRQTREELGLLGTTIRTRKPRAIRFVRDAGGNTTHVETPDGMMAVSRGPDGLPVSLDPMDQG